MSKLKQATACGLILLSLSASSCATIFGGPVTDYQRTKPAAGQPQRSVRVGALIADIVLFLPSLVVDFATGAIYKPQGK
ncbi:hypothetical protein [Hymenobacter psoromatis]|uniref:hypothetical protein n=1 Tax=Hymenobacter psoromatis TaxID=1484116 RepID=UPI001CBC792E|nr:hypothetical protein [Hymenobacter psoromatis]